MKTVVSAEEPNDQGLDKKIENILHDKLSHFLDDIEFRLAQTREYRNQITQGESGEKIVATQVFAEDLVTQKHQLTGYTITNNSPGGGSIAWASVHVVYNGVDYTITNGNTALKYCWFDAAVSTTVMQTNNTKPTLAGNACLLFYNDGGIAREVLNASMPPVVANAAIDSGAIQANAVGTTAIANGAVTGAKTDFYATLSAAVTAAQSAADLAQATADGAINTYFQSAQPWAPGASHTPDRIGDIWYDSDDGQAYRWSGNGGTWVMIEDSNISAALTAANNAQTTANSKITTFYAVHASTPTATAIGDLWVVTDRDNLTRRASAVGTGSWVDLTIGTQAIANTAITTAKIANQAVTSTQIGNNAVGATQLGSGAVTPVKLNVLQHVLY